MSGRVLSDAATILLALVMAFLVWMVAVREEDPIITRNFTPRVPIRYIQPAENLFIVDDDSLPSDVLVEIKAPQSIWQNLSLGKIKAFVDLSTYGAGEHTVPVEVEISEGQATVTEMAPSDVTVQIAPLAMKELPVTVQVKDSPAQGYFNRLPDVTPEVATVKGSLAAVQSVEQLVANVSLNNSKETIKETALLMALTADGERVLDVLIEPSTAQATIPIEQRFGYKDVSVKANVIGQPALGYWVSSITVDPTTVTLVGGPAVLRDVSGFIETAEVNITGATENVVKRVPLNLPPGASIVVDENQDSENGRSVLVTVGVSALTGGRTVQVGLTPQGLQQGYTYTTAPDTVEVILTGPLPILQGMKPDDVSAIIDLFGLSVGTHRLQPEIIYPEGLEMTSLNPDAVEITIREEISTPTPRPTRTPTATPTITSTVELTGTATVILSDSLAPTATMTLTVTPDASQKAN